MSADLYKGNLILYCVLVLHNRTTVNLLTHLGKKNMKYNIFIIVIFLGIRIFCVIRGIFE